MQNREWKYIKSRAVLWAALLFFVLGVAGVGIGLLPTPFSPAATVEAAMRRETLTIETQSGRQVFEIEVAESPDEKAKGLMFRAKIPDGTGMLFPYGAPQEITMWMKNTYASLDMVFIRGDGIVHRIETNTEPMSERVIASGGPVTAVLELAAGAAAKFGIKAGDRIIHKEFPAKPN